jgi:HKD family nuclease
MSKGVVGPLWAEGAVDLSVVAGVSEGFDLRELLKGAKTVRIAAAFGSLKGWEKVEDHLKSSSAETVQVLLGQAFYQTDPRLLFRLRGLQGTSQGPKFGLMIAPMAPVFHPKVWIIDSQDKSVCVVGSGNLTAGGLLDNVECGLLTNVAAEVDALRSWFDGHWKAAPELSKTLDAYVAKHQELSRHRRATDLRIADAMKQQAQREAQWQKRDAINRAAEYWRGLDGLAAVKAQDRALERMQGLLHFKSWDFSPAEFSEFLRISALGHILLFHEALLLAELPAIKNRLGSLDNRALRTADHLDALQRIPGVGPNLATKLLAVYDPERFIVVNEPVKTALRSFGFKMAADLDGKGYELFLREVRDFVEEAESQGLRPAAALDAFFFEYRNFGR